MKFLIFGTGKIAAQVMKAIGNVERYIEIVGIIDNDERKQNGMFYGKAVKSPSEVRNLEYDYICILAGEGYQNIYNQLVYGYHVEKHRVVDRLFLLKQVMTCKYRDDTDADIRDTVSYWGRNRLSFFNQFEFAPASRERVWWDEDNNMPYVFFAGRRLYYPRTYRDIFAQDGSLWVTGYREMEQHARSPHRYLNDEINIGEGDIVVDAGAREGDFALPYMDKIKKLYLFEPDPGWVEALKMTYKDYGDKVVVIPKLLSDTVSENTITLMEAVSERTVDFIKMDIEGAEVKVLSAAEKMLRDSHIKGAICCYHKRGDECNIIHIFHKNGYDCSTSKGHVVFVDDPDIFETLDFRHGIVYVKKSESKK